MRVIKGNTAKYAAFHKSLPTISKSFNGNKTEYFYKKPDDRSADSDNHSEILEDISGFLSQLNNADSIKKIKTVLTAAVSNRIDLAEADFFLFDSTNTSLVSPENTSSTESHKFINNAHKEGILEWAFSSKAPRTIPVYRSYSIQEDGSYCLIVPLFEGTNAKGIFSVMHNNPLQKNSSDLSYIQVLVNCAFQKINLLIKTEETKLAYNSLQAYQSKLSNDYRLYAVGELAGGVLEEILEPLQVIYSSIDLLNTNNSNKEILAAVKNQLRKIQLSTDRLIKFSDRSDYNNRKVLPCDLNKIIENYNSIISSSLEKKKIECILDLEQGLPSILTHSDLIIQMLVNIFSIITSDFSKPGGIVIQTQLVKDIVKLSFLTTEVIETLDKNSSDPNYKIVLQLVQRHEGQLEVSSNESFGSRIEIRFPLKRKIRA